MKKIDRDYNKFAQQQIAKLDSIRHKYLEGVQSEYDYDQDLVFKIKTIQKVPDIQFRQYLKSADVETLISRPGKSAEWIVTANDPTFSKLKRKIRSRVQKTKSDFIDGIDKFDEIKYEDKIGPLLKEKPLEQGEVAKINVSLTRKEGEFGGKKLNSAVEHIRILVTESSCQICDILKTENLCMLLVECNSKLLRDIAKFDLVIKLDRTPEFVLEKTLAEGQSTDMNVSPPPDDANGILVMDSGVIRHPLLDPAIPDDGYAGLEDRPSDDDRHHGTMVAGNSLYGNLEPRILDRSFEAKFWIYSAKIFYQSNSRVMLCPDKLPYSTIKESLADIKSRFPNCRVVNLSFGSTDAMPNDGSQPELASLIDDLSNEYRDTMFVVSMGNAVPPAGNDSFLDRLCNSGEDIRLGDPASSVHALSIGALQETSSGTLIPSDITKTGPGLNDMVKPELVELGGGLHKKLIVLNPNYRQKTFTLNSGTSFSTPIIANYLAELTKKFPNYSRNLIMALLIASSNYPKPIPEPFPKTFSNISTENFLTISNTYGYGRPNLANALMSDENRVVFKFEGSIEVDHVIYFEIKIPDVFATESGNRFISASLVFDPPVRRNRADYFGTRVEFRMFRNRTIEELQGQYNKHNTSRETASIVPEELRRDEIKLVPKSSLRKMTPHQNGKAILTSRYDIDPSKPLTLVVFCQKRWTDAEKQNFSVVVTMEHEKQIDLYNKLQALNVVRPVLTSRVQV